MRNVSEKPCREFKIQGLFSITLFRKSGRLWDNVEQYGRTRQATDDNVVICMPFACCITKITGTHSECVILIAFPLQQWLRERASILRYTYIDSLVTSHSFLANSTIMSQIRNTLPLIFFPVYLIIALALYSKLTGQPKHFLLHEKRSVKTMRKTRL